MISYNDIVFILLSLVNKKEAVGFQICGLQYACFKVPYCPGHAKFQILPLSDGSPSILAVFTPTVFPEIHRPPSALFPEGFSAKHRPKVPIPQKAHLLKALVLGVLILKIPSFFMDTFPINLWWKATLIPPLIFPAASQLGKLKRRRYLVASPFQ